MVRRWIKDFFSLSHAQANGLIVLVPLLVIALFSEPVWHTYVSRREEDFSADQKKLDSLVALWDNKKNSTPRNDDATLEADLLKPQRFTFDPNKASQGDLQALGFSQALATRIARYREKGGKFRVKSDLLKIYGIDSTFYDQLYGFISLPEKIKWERTIKEKNPVLLKPSAATSAFDLNQADSSQLKKIYGIGEKLSLRILKYRDALGGFITADQVSEIYGLDSLVAGRLMKAGFVAGDFKPLRLNINSAREADLAVHPYLRRTIAKAIVAYRFQHGEFRTIEDLRKIQVLDEKTIQKIAPYLTVND